MNLSSGVRLRSVSFVGTENLPGLLTKAQYVQHPPARNFYASFPSNSKNYITNLTASIN